MSKLRSDIYETEDHIYYNVIISNPNNYSIPATFVEDRVQAIVDDPSEYYLSVIRFLVPGQNVPIFIFSDLPTYSITLSYNNVDYQNYVAYNPLTLTPSTEDGFYFVYSYQHMINMINATFASAFQALIAANPGIANYPPYLTFNPQNQLITLVAEQTSGAYSPTTEGGNYIKIYMNAPLYSFFESFNNFFSGETANNGKAYQILVKNYGNNVSFGLTPSSSPDPIIYPAWLSTWPYGINDIIYNPSDSKQYVSLTNNNLNNPPVVGPNWALAPANPAHYTGAVYQISQEFPTLYNWNSFRNIVFTSGTVPIQAEYVPSVSGSFVDAGLNNYRRILTDFQPVVAQGPDARSYFQYFPQSEYRLISFTSNQPLRRFDLTIYWESNGNVLYPLLIPPYDEVTVKFMFRKKNFNKGTLNPENIAKALKKVV